MFSPIQIFLASQYFIIPIGHVEDIEFDITRVNTYVDFKVVDIMGDKYPYPALLGIDWEFENYVVIDLKLETINFKVDGIRFIQPLDSYQGPWFTNPIDDEEEPNILDQLYQITAGNREDYINPTTDGSISWRSVQHT